MSELVDALMAQVLAQMSVISEVKAYDYDGIRVHGGDPGRIPSLPEKPMIDFYRERYLNAKSARTKRLIVLEAAEALQVARRQPLPRERPPMTHPLWARWVAESTADTGDLARWYGVSRQYIWQVRKKYRNAA